MHDLIYKLCKVNTETLPHLCKDYPFTVEVWSIIQMFVDDPSLLLCSDDERGSAKFAYYMHLAQCLRLSSLKMALFGFIQE